jgi:hypothetical protein
LEDKVSPHLFLRPKLIAQAKEFAEIIRNIKVSNVIDYYKAPYLGSMISKRRGMVARVRRSADTVTSISSTRWISRSI